MESFGYAHVECEHTDRNSSLISYMRVAYKTVKMQSTGDQRKRAQAYSKTIMQ